MYYIEKVIDGILCCKTTPNGDWRPLSLEKLTDRIVNYERRILQLENELEEQFNK